MAVEIPVVIDIEQAFKDAANRVPAAIKPLQGSIEKLEQDLLEMRELMRGESMTSQLFADAAKEVQQLEQWLTMAKQRLNELTTNEGSLKRFSGDLATIREQWAEMGSKQMFDSSGKLSDNAKKLQKDYANVAIELDKVEKLLTAEYDETVKINAENQKQVEADRRHQQALIMNANTIDQISQKLAAWTAELNKSNVGSNAFINASMQVQILTEELRKATEQAKQLGANIGSIDSSNAKLQSLQAEFNALSKAEREGAEGSRIIAEYRRELALIGKTLPQIISDEEKYSAELRKRSELIAANTQRRRTESAVLATTAQNMKTLQAQEAILSKQLNTARFGSQQYRNIEEQLIRVRMRMQEVGGAVNVTNDALRRQGMIMTSLTSYASMYISVFGLIRFVKQIRDVTGELEYQRIALGHLIQDEEYGARMFEKIKENALKSPFQIKDLVTYTKQLAAYRIEQENLLDTTKRLADISAGLGVDMNRLILAYGQVRSAAVLRGQELRQFTEAGIPLVELLADKMGELHNTTYKTADVFKLISARAVPFSAISDIFEDLTEKGGMFYKMQEEQANTLKGRWEKLKDAFSIGLQQIGETQEFMLENKILLNSLTFLAKNLNVVPKILTSIAAAWVVYTLATRKATRAVNEARLAKVKLTTDEMREIIARNLNTRATEALTRARIKEKAATTLLSRTWWKLNAAMIANPVGAIIAGVTALISLFVLWNKRTKQQTESYKDLTDAIEAVSQSERTFKRMEKQIDTYEKLAAKTERTSKENVELARTLSVLRQEFPGVKLTVDETNESLSKSVETLRKLNQENKLAGMQKAFRAKEMANDKVSELRAEIARLTREQDDIWTDYENQKNADNEEKARKARNKYDEVGEQIEENNKQLIQYLKYIEELDKYLNGTEDDHLAFWQKVMKKMKDFKVDDKTFNLISESDIEGYETLYDALKKIDKLYKETASSVEEMKVGLSSVNDEYRDTAEEEIKVEEARRDAAKAILDTFGFTSEKKKKAENNSLAVLKEELKNVQEIYKRYKEFLKYMSDSEAQKKIKEIYGGVTTIDFLSPELYKKRLSALLAELRKMQGRVRIGAKNLTAEMAADLKEMLRGDEGFRSKAYKLPGEKAYTIGYGFYNQLTDGRKVVEGMTMTVEEAEEELNRQVERTAKLTSDLIQKYGNGLELTERQFNILANLAYQGPATLKRALQKANGDVNELAEALKDAAWPYVASGLQAAVKVRDMRRATLFKMAGATSDEDAKEVVSTMFDLERLVQDVDFDELKDGITKKLEDLSSDIKKSETARNFFNDILEMTGDQELATTLTMQVYGQVGDDFKQRVQNEMFGALATVKDVTGDDFYNEMLGNITIFDMAEIRKQVARLPEAVRPVFERLLDEEQKYNSDWLKDFYKTYNDASDLKKKINTIEARRTQKLTEAKGRNATDEQISDINAAFDREIAETNLQILKTTPQWVKAFEDLEGVGTHTLTKLLELIRTYRTEYGASLTSEELKNLTQQEQKVEDEKISRNPYADTIKSMKAYFSALAKMNKLKKEGKEETLEFENAENDSKKALKNAKTAVNAVNDAFNNLSTIVNEVSEIIDFDEYSDGEAIMTGIAEGLGLVGTALVFINAMLELMNTNPIVLAITGVIAGIAAIAKILENLKVNRANRELEEQNKILESLEDAYGKLDKAIAKAFGSDYIYNYNEQLKNLEAQVVANEKSIVAERSKGKKADEDAIKGFNDAIEDAKEQMADMKTQLSEFFTDSDITSAATDFAESWIEAYKEFGSTTDAMKEKFEDMIQSMVVKSLAAQVMKNILTPVMNAIDEYSQSGGELDASEIASISAMTKDSIGTINAAMNTLMSDLAANGLNLRNTAGSFTGISRTIAGASEESINTLAAAVNTQNFYISYIPMINENVARILEVMGGDATRKTPTGAAFGATDYYTQMLVYAENIPIMNERLGALLEAFNSVITPKNASNNWNCVAIK